MNKRISQCPFCGSNDRILRNDRLLCAHCGTILEHKQSFIKRLIQKTQKLIINHWGAILICTLIIVGLLLLYVWINEETHQYYRQIFFWL